MRRSEDFVIAVKVSFFNVAATFNVLLAALALSGSALKVQAQQTVYNVPTTGVLDQGKVYFEMDMSITETGEVEVVETIRRDRDAYYQVFDTLCQQPMFPSNSRWTR